MAIYNSNEMIRMIRKKSGLSQEEFCDGICSVQALSNIENGKNGVSPITFDMFTAKANIYVRPFPCFASEEDFECFMDLHRAEFYIDSWQFNYAYEELKKVEDNKFADNKFCYQRWMALHCKIRIISKKCDYSEVTKLILHALSITMPNGESTGPLQRMISPTEFLLLVLLANSYINMELIVEATQILESLESNLDNIKVSELARFLRKADIAYLKEKIFLINGDFAKLLEHSCEWYRKATAYHRSIPIFYFAFMQAVALYQTGNKNESVNMFREVIAGASIIQCLFTDICVEYIEKETDLSIEIFEDIIRIPNYFVPKDVKKYDVNRMDDGVYSLSENNIVTYGKLLRLLRRRYNMTAEAIYNGICSKSQYSKIENDCVLPSVIMARNLLERAGITENIFDFFGNDDEFKYADLVEKISSLSLLDKDKADELLDEMKQLKISKNKLVEQEILFFKAIYSCDGDELESQLLNAMSITKENFTLDKIGGELFTNTEFNIIQHYTRSLLKNTDKVKKGIEVAEALIKHYSTLGYDITQCRITIPMLLFISAPYLRRANMVSNLEAIYNMTTRPLMQYNVAIKASIYMDYLLLRLSLTKKSYDKILGLELKIAYYSIKLLVLNNNLIQSINERLEQNGISMA